MQVTFLGTGTSQGVPVIACTCPVCSQGTTRDRRLRTSVLISHKDTQITIDAGPDFRYQMLREGVQKLDGILITHSHKDHIAGLDDVRSFNYIYRKAMNIYAMERDQEAIRKEFSYAFGEDRYPGVPDMNLITLTEEPFKLGDLDIIPLPVLHMKMQVMGFRIGDFSYITDTNYIPGETLEKIAGSKIIVLNALRKKPHPSHFNLEEAVKVLEFLRPEKAYLTHISHLLGFHDDVQKELPDFIDLAYDGLKITI
ncbi:MAG: MBL fold metallo-hydrolase [Bacteroidales bacterium]|nr:MBL fold metallo-hydrolase [Bacteroidales bacterium]